MATTSISDKAQVGFSNSTAYDSHRPSYSPTVVEFLLQQLRVSGKKHAKVLDLAAGTGKFTEALAARDEEFEIVAVEPHEQMRGTLKVKGLRGVTVLEGKGESIPLEDASVDAVVCAQAFHWFANMDALREIHRVLHPHGCLGMVWNIDDYNAPKEYKATTDWEAKLHDLTWTFEDDNPRYRHEEWRKVLEDQGKPTPLSLVVANEHLFSLPLGKHEERYEVHLSKEGLWERYNTLSHIAVLEGKKKEDTYRTFMEALSGPDVETDADGNVVAHGGTIAVWTSSIPEDGRGGLGDTVETP